MSWSSLGILQPKSEWQLYSVPVIGTETFKFTNFWTIPPYYRMRAYLGQFYGTTDEVVVSRAIYPFKGNESVLDLAIPIAFKDAGITTRYVGIKLGSFVPLGANAYDWQVQIWEYL